MKSNLRKEVTRVIHRQYSVLTLLLLCFTFATTAFAEAPEKTEQDDYAYIDNGKLKLGVKKSSGAGIAWISRNGSDRNLVNHWDRGRLIQQSYYGVSDDSLWHKQKWLWNPVQGGDWKGKPARVLELKVEPTQLFAKTLPRHWASGAELPETQMEQRIRLDGELIHVEYRFLYTGKTEHPVRDQEIPAVFLQPELNTLVLYDGSHPWTGDKLHRSQPGWPNEPRKIHEHWAAYVDQHNQGLGVYVPVANTLTCYRFGDGKAEHGACSYFAPLTQFAIKPGFDWKYDLWITLGSVEEIRQRFQKLAQAPVKPAVKPSAELTPSQK